MEEKKKSYWAQDFATMKIENDLWIILVFIDNSYSLFTMFYSVKRKGKRNYSILGIELLH